MKGFDFSLVKMGGFTLKRVLPRLVIGRIFDCCSCRAGVLVFSVDLLTSAFDVLMALTALMLPSFLRQGFSLQANM